MSRPRPWKSRLTPAESRRGWVFFALYVLVFPALMGQLQRLLDRRFGPLLPAGVSGLICHALLLCAALLLFRGLLRKEFDLLLDFLPENLSAFFTALAGAGALHGLTLLLPRWVEDPGAPALSRQFAAAPLAAGVILFLFLPITEELLFRGLLYGGLRWYSRPLAFAASAAGYALFCVLPFAAHGDVRALLLLPRYLPMSLALTWCYDRGGSVWSAAALHAVLNALILLLSISMI